MCVMELKQFYCHSSHEWIEDVLSHLSKSENEDLVRQTLEAHTASQPSRAEEEKQAYGWVQWAKHREHLKVLFFDFQTLAFDMILSFYLKKLINQKPATFNTYAIHLHRLLHVTYHQEYCRKM